MVGLAPCPGSSDAPYNETETAVLDEGEKMTAVFEPEGASTTAMLPIVAASKYAGATYEILLDGETRYGPASVPPTDIDNLEVTFIPSYQWNERIEVIVRNVSAGDARMTTVQVIGWEEVTG
ncbi:hypothetical protein [Halorhabdus amylolytica]|uniref:hypothetical protein n=1 Tax=Halorhabdus amylolytica TaxID=2559573 RepID=UPI0010A9D02B|nr:hypothetical protein [Halorhabdus amylolytica]